MLVIVDRLTEMEIYLPCRKDIDSLEHARMIVNHVLCRHAVRDPIITDRGTQFTSRFCNWLCYHMGINHWLLTAVCPQTNSQMERQNETLEQYLQAFCNYNQDNWVELLPLVDVAYNNYKHALTKMTRF